MTSAFSGARPLFAAGFVLISAALAACGDDGVATNGSAASAAATQTVSQATDASAAPAASTAPAAGTAPTVSTAPTITGAPGTMVTAGQAYSFQPQASSAAGSTVTFSITNLPSWAQFNTTTGLLSGTPSASQVGQYAGIVITATAGTQSAALAAFTITVAANPDSAASTVTLSWVPPTENADGTPLKDLKGFQVHYGSASQSYSDTIQISNPGLSTYVVQNLPAGKYYFAVTAYNSTGQESSLSPEVSTTLD